MGQGEPENIDPWEPLNREVFAFNDWLDKYALKPVAQAYRAITPDPIERGVTNFINNIYEFNNIANALLQGRVDNALHSSGRFLLNSTVGLAGFLDVASPAGVTPRPADFGQTLATWGVPSGPFIMVPVAGPRTLRSGTGLLVDSLYSIPALTGETTWPWVFWGVVAIDTRANLLQADTLITGDRYIFFRNAYLQSRETFLNGGVVIDDFSDFEEGEDYEDF